MLPVVELPLLSDEPVWDDEEPLVELPCEAPVLLDDEPPVPVVLPVEPVPEVELPLPEV